MPAILDADRVERATNQMVPHTGKVLHAATPYQDNGMFLEIVADSGNIGRDLHAVRQPDPRNFP